ncbi:MAG: MlaD family protein, partial [Gammaproteobacteria bacterium]
MKRDSINYLIVGSVVLAALGLLLYVLYRLTGGVDENTRYHVHYPNVGGLRQGTPVTYEGYKIGVVAAIDPVRNG